MRQEDVAQVTKIDREAFPTQLPPPNYQHELRNRLAHYIVACDEEKTADPVDTKTTSEKNLTGPTSIWRRLFNRHRSSGHALPTPSGHYITGFAGFWVMANEAHIISIAVREAYRRRGIGELLLISLIGLTIELKARFITLEVRASNTAAQNLYTKYGFSQVGVRRGYYIDDREDAVLMSTQDIAQAEFQAHFQRLKQIHARKVGIARYQIAR